ncbi:MAG TPA: hypothetical protein VIT38_01095 [Allosphingosinicella sp.]|jgi:hypothetical protein
MKKLFLIAGASLALLATPASAVRTARCVIQSAGERTWRGPCRFVPDGPGGTFAVFPVRGTFPGGIGDISVAIIRPGVAEVRGNTSDGINSRWGEARRSRRDPACWVGSDFSVCAY